jgi:hypothetical protein
MGEKSRSAWQSQNIGKLPNEPVAVTRAEIEALLHLQVESVFRKSNRLTSDWTISGNTRFAAGFPVTLYDNSYNSLRGTLGNGANNYLLDTPQYLPGEDPTLGHIVSAAAPRLVQLAAKFNF